jgi:hypothetical protein
MGNLACSMLDISTNEVVEALVYVSSNPSVSILSPTNKPDIDLTASESQIDAGMPRYRFTNTNYD